MTPEKMEAPDFSNCTATVARLLLGCVIEEGSYVGLQLCQIFFVQIHHVAGVVILQLDILLQVFRQAEMSHGEFGGKKGCCQVVESILDFDVKMRIGYQGIDQIFFDVGSTGESVLAVTAGALPIPLAASALGGRVVG